MGLNNDPLCEHCEGELKTSLHFISQWSYYVTTRMSIWGKPVLDPDDMKRIRVSVHAHKSAGVHAVRAAMLNERLPNLSWERGTSISLLVADRSVDWDMHSDAGCSMSLT